MKTEIEEKLCQMGYDTIIEQLEEHGVLFQEINDAAFAMYVDQTRSFVCQYTTAEEVTDFLDIYKKIIIEDNSANIISEMRKVQTVKDFESIMKEYTFNSRDDRCYYFILNWKCIPSKEAFYEIYKEVLTDNESRDYYNQLIKPNIVEEVRKYNHADTVDNEELKSLLDENGYLTVYHGHCKKTLRGSYSWTTDYDTAKWFGARHALFSHSEQYYVVTGKVKLKDIITYINDRNEREVLVKPSDVKDKKKEYFSAAERAEKPSFE